VLADPVAETGVATLSKPPQPAGSTNLAPAVDETGKLDSLEMLDPPTDGLIATHADDITLAELSNAIESEDRLLRQVAVEALQRIGPPSVPVLAKALSREPLSFENRGHLGKEGGALCKAWMELVEQGQDLSDTWANDIVPSHFMTMVEPRGGFLAVGMLPGLCLGMLVRTDLDGRRQVAEALGSIGTDALPHLILAVRQDVKRFEGLPHAIDLDHVDLLSGWYLKRLDDDIRGIARVGPKAIPAIENVILDQDEEVTVRLVMVAALGEMGEPAVAALSGALCSNDGIEGRLVRDAAMQAFARIGEPAIPVLAELLQVGCEDLRHQAIGQLGKLGSKEALPALIATLHDWDEDTRFRAVEAIGRIGPEGIEARSALSRLLRDPSERVRRSAALALGKERQPSDDDHGFH
jgi:HEAT repeat protein